MTKLYVAVAVCIVCVVLTGVLLDRPYECEVVVQEDNQRVDHDAEILRVSKVAILRSGVSEGELSNIPYQDDKLVGTNASRSNRFITAWMVDNSNVRYSVYVTVKDDIANCKVVKSK